MKNLINKYTIFTFILGMLICGFSVYAYVISSSDVSYEAENPAFTAPNVESALNTLYDRSGKIADRIDGTFQIDYYTGSYAEGGGPQLNFSKGNYYVLIPYALGYWNTNYSNATITNNMFQELVSVNYISITNMTCEPLNCDQYKYLADSKMGSNYIGMTAGNCVLKCNSLDNGHIKINGLYDQSNLPAYINLNSIKID